MALPPLPSTGKSERSPAPGKVSGRQPVASRAGAPMSLRTRGPRAWELCVSSPPETVTRSRKCKMRWWPVRGRWTSGPGEDTLPCGLGVVSGHPGCQAGWWRENRGPQRFSWSPAPPGPTQKTAEVGTPSARLRRPPPPCKHTLPAGAPPEAKGSHTQTSRRSPLLRLAQGPSLQLRAPSPDRATWTPMAQGA